MTTSTFGNRTGSANTAVEDAMLYSGGGNLPSQTTVDQPSLIRFPDLFTILSGNTVTSAVLTLSFNSGNAGTQTINIRKCLRDWIETEATKDVAKTTGGTVSWTTTQCGSDGNDRAASNSCVIPYPGGFATGSVDSTSNTQLIADIQAIADGGVNNGWLIDATNVMNSIGMSIRMPAYATATERPLLTVIYSSASTAVASRKLLIGVGS